MVTSKPITPEPGMVLRDHDEDTTVYLYGAGGTWLATGAELECEPVWPLTTEHYDVLWPSELELLRRRMAELYDRRPDPEG